MRATHFSSHPGAKVAVALCCAVSALLSGCNDSMTESSPPPIAGSAGGPGSPAAAGAGAPNIFLSVSPASVSSGGAALLGISSPAVVDNGNGNTVSGNSPDSSADPLMVNSSGNLSLLADFQPTQNYSGGAAVPVWYDALSIAWSPAWSLGAVKP